MTQERFFELVYAWKDGDLTGDELYQRVLNLINTKEAIIHDKILSMTDEFVRSNRIEGQFFSDYHYDMMADFALHILETFKTKER